MYFNLFSHHFFLRPPLRTFGGFKGWEGEGADLPGWNACLDAYMYTIQVLTYLDDLPDDTWPESDPKDPLSLVDKVINNNTTSLNRNSDLEHNLCAYKITLVKCYVDSG